MLVCLELIGRTLSPRKLKILLYDNDKLLFEAKFGDYDLIR